MPPTGTAATREPESPFPSIGARGFVPRSRFHRERNHQAMGGKLLMPDQATGTIVGRVACRERLGGTLKYCYREAA